MHELRELKERWWRPDPPSAAAYTAARAALLDKISAVGGVETASKRARWRVPRLGWLVGSTAVTAALAASVAFAVVPGGSPPRTGQPGAAPPHGPARSYDGFSGSQILLAAADVAQGQPATSGKYWHVKSLETADGITSTFERWTTRDGVGYAGPVDAAVLSVPWGAFSLGNARTLEDIETLPTDPDALKAWAINSATHPAPPAPPPSGVNPPRFRGDPIPEAEVPAQAAVLLTALLYEVPAPPAVRAAAFRALVTLTNVTNLGPQDGGHALRIAFPLPPADKFPDGKVPAGAGQQTLVIDPATGALFSQATYQGTTRVLVAEWTDTTPKIVTPKKKEGDGPPKIATPKEE